MINLPINGGFYESDSLPISNQECTNYYVNIPQTEGALSQAALFGTPGIEQIATTGTTNNSNRGSHVKDGKPYFVNGCSLYRLDLTQDTSGNDVLTLVNLGLVSGEGRVSFADNGKQLMFVTDGEGWIVDESDATIFQQITDTDFKANGTPEQVVFIDSFFVVTTDSKKFIKSAANDGLSWNALDFGSAEADPDPIVAPIVYKNQLFIAGTEVIEVFENRGLGGFPFQRNGLILNKGVSSPFGIVSTSDTFMFIGGGVNESPAIWAMAGSDVQKVSTTAIDNVLRSMSPSEIGSAFAWAYAQSGAYFVGFTFNSRTFVFDTITGKWHERKSSFTDSRGASLITKWRVNSIVTAFNRVIVSDAIDGRVGVLDLEVYLEYGNNIHRTFSTAPFSNQGAGFTIPRIEITMESGEGLGDISEPKIRLSISKDSKTFNNELSRGFGKVGEFFKRSIWRRLGRFSRYSVLKFEMSDAVKPTIIKLEADIKGGTK